MKYKSSSATASGVALPSTSKHSSIPLFQTLRGGMKRRVLAAVVCFSVTAQGQASEALMKYILVYRCGAPQLTQAVLAHCGSQFSALSPQTSPANAKWLLVNKNRLQQAKKLCDRTLSVVPDESELAHDPELRSIQGRQARVKKIITNTISDAISNMKKSDDVEKECKKIVAQMSGDKPDRILEDLTDGWKNY